MKKKHYNKIVKCINSCENKNHLEACDKMVQNFLELFSDGIGAFYLRKLRSEKYYLLGLVD